METPLTVGAVMTPAPVAVSPDTNLTDIVALLAKERISAVAVVDGDGAPIGVVSEADLPNAERTDDSGNGERSGTHAARRPVDSRARPDGNRASDLMSVPVRTIAAGTPIAEAARELGTRGLHRLFVVDGEGKLTGVVTRADLLDVYLRPDHDVQREIEKEVFGRVLRAEPASFSVSVDHGVVTVLGRLERRSAVTSAGRLIPLVHGVIGVRNRLDYVWDDERL